MKAKVERILLAMFPLKVHPIGNVAFAWFSQRRRFPIEMKPSHPKVPRCVSPRRVCLTQLSTVQILYLRLLGLEHLGSF